MSKLRPLLLPQMIEARERLSGEIDSNFSVSRLSLISQYSSYSTSNSVPSPITPASTWLPENTPENKTKSQYSTDDSVLSNSVEKPYRLSDTYSLPAPVLRSYSSYDHPKKDSQLLAEVKEEAEVENMHLGGVYPNFTPEFNHSACDIPKLPNRPLVRPSAIFPDADEIDNEPYSAWSDEEKPRRRRLRKRRVSETLSITRSSIFGSRMSQRFRTFPISRTWRGSRVSLSSSLEGPASTSMCNLPTPEDSPSSFEHSRGSSRADSGISMAPVTPIEIEEEDEEAEELLKEVDNMHITLPATRYDPYASRKNRSDDSTRTPLLPPPITGKSPAERASLTSYPFFLPERSPPPDCPPPPVPAKNGVNPKAIGPVRISAVAPRTQTMMVMTPPPSPPSEDAHKQKEQRVSQATSHRTSASSTGSKSDCTMIEHGDSRPTSYEQLQHILQRVSQSDPWSPLLGHANFTIHPEPYLPPTCTIATLKQLRADWDEAKRSFDHHLHLTGEHYGQDSDLFRISQCKWSSLDKQWAAANKQVIDGIINDVVAKKELSAFCITQQEIELSQEDLQLPQPHYERQQQHHHIHHRLQKRPSANPRSRSSSRSSRSPPESPRKGDGQRRRRQHKQRGELPREESQEREKEAPVYLRPTLHRKTSSLRTIVKAWWG